MRILRSSEWGAFRLPIVRRSLVQIQTVMPEMAETMGQRLLRGAIVAWVLPDEPAQKAGMISGDVILRFDGETFSDERALLRE